MKIVRLSRKLAYIAWTEFETWSQLPGPSLKLGPRFFFTFVCYIKNKIQQSVD
jgi:hypothetical protein